MRRNSAPDADTCRERRRKDFPALGEQLPVTVHVVLERGALGPKVPRRRGEGR